MQRYLQNNVKNMSRSTWIGVTPELGFSDDSRLDGVLVVKWVQAGDGMGGSQVRASSRGRCWRAGVCEQGSSR